MKFANVRELKNKTSEILRKAEKEAVVITSKGKPRAIITAISEEDFEDYLLESSPQLLQVLEEARQEDSAKGGVTISSYLKSFPERQIGQENQRNGIGLLQTQGGQAQSVLHA